ncbi:hypothetical protein H5410_003435, partial [Solanum commersonii]
MNPKVKGVLPYSKSLGASQAFTRYLTTLILDVQCLEVCSHVTSVEQACGETCRDSGQRPHPWYNGGCEIGHVAYERVSLSDGCYECGELGHYVHIVA